MVQEAQVTVRKGQECSGASMVQEGYLDRFQKASPEQVMHPAECSKVQEKREDVRKDMTVSVPAKIQIAEVAENDNPVCARKTSKPAQFAKETGPLKLIGKEDKPLQEEPGSKYDLWMDLKQMKLNISLDQFLSLVPSYRT